MPDSTAGLRIRAAIEEDAPVILHFIKAIAEYEKLSDRVQNNEDLIREWVFRRNAAGALIAEWDGTPVGFALHCATYSSFAGRPTMFLEDVFVNPDMRGRGIGKALMRRVAAEAVQRGYGRMEWICLDWNRPSIAFYKSLGAHPLDDWTTFRLDGPALSALGT